jgi:hypothetical protein
MDVPLVPEVPGVPGVPGLFMSAVPEGFEGVALDWTPVFVVDVFVVVVVRIDLW